MFVLKGHFVTALRLIRARHPKKEAMASTCTQGTSHHIFQRCCIVKEDFVGSAGIDENNQGGWSAYNIE